MGKNSVSLKNPDVDKAYNAALRQLARQDRTRKELLDKLKRWYTEEATQAAVERVESRGYLKPDTELIERHSQTQRNKGRGHYRINQELKKRGLPTQALDPEMELTQCQKIYLKKFGDQTPDSPQERAALREKAARFLVNRGFDLETIKKVIYEKR